jgi:hypothetical protein
MEDGRTRWPERQSDPTSTTRRLTADSCSTGADAGRDDRSATRQPQDPEQRRQQNVASSGRGDHGSTRPTEDQNRRDLMRGQIRRLRTRTRRARQPRHDPDKGGDPPREPGHRHDEDSHGLNKADRAEQPAKSTREVMKFVSFDDFNVINGVWVLSMDHIRHCPL